MTTTKIDETLSQDQREAAALAYEIHRDMIDKTVAGFVKRYGGDFEEYRGDADSFFTKAMAYEPNPGISLETHIRYCVWYSLMDQHRTRLRRGKRHDNFEVAESIGIESNQVSMIERISADLSNDAKTLLQLLTEAPPEIAEVIKPPLSASGCIEIRLAVQQYLRNLGWVASRIRDSFNELGEAVIS